MILCWTSDGWNDYLHWQRQDSRTLRRINDLIKDIMRSPFEGIGKPEPLKWNLTGAWSRRINATHRLIYTVDRDRIVILSARNHY